MIAYCGLVLRYVKARRRQRQLHARIQEQGREIATLLEMLRHLEQDAQ